MKITEKNWFPKKEFLSYREDYLKKEELYSKQIEALEEKKNYYIAELPEDHGVGIRFSDLLGKALNGWIDPSYFVYKDEAGNQQAVPYTYHLFDDTSRGLNNVYNVLNDIIAKRTSNNESEQARNKEYIEEKKLLLDTIIAAKKNITNTVMIFIRNCLRSVIPVKTVQYSLIMQIPLYIEKIKVF